MDEFHGEMKFHVVLNDLKYQDFEAKAAISPALNVFLYVGDAAVFSLLSAPSTQIPFVHAVAVCHGWDYDENSMDPRGPYEDDSPGPEEHYKVAIELLGRFWSHVGTGSMGMDELGPRDVGGICTDFGNYESLYEGEAMEKVKKELLK
ncbi:hypothetical protein CJF30_00003132 [Rutstroemia sp. NJR-2017a BBW]|nr:hypothetical protein CJF30_00003132 [Rutstroemia sp. NJR-2017a BBW]